jgi:hypothetical protein
LTEKKVNDMTAVEWLVQQIETGKIEIVYSDKIHSIRCLPEFVKEALEMEKQQIKDAYNQGYRDGEDDSSGKDISLYNDAELYFNETFKKDKL